MMLIARDLTRRLRGRALVAGVTLDIRPAEMLGLIGPNGSGKSTLLRMLAGLVRHIALVAQSAETSDRITVRDAVALGRTPWLDALRPWSPADEAHVTQALARVDLAHLAGRDWSTLSGGERQRAHIARALAQAPRILLLDEPTNHLDIRHQLAILDLVGGLGLTTVIALHDLNQAMRCDRLAVMQAGRLVALGPPDRILTADLLARVFQVRASTLTDPQDGSRVMRFHPVV